MSADLTTPAALFTADREDPTSPNQEKAKLWTEGNVGSGGCRTITPAVDLRCVYKNK
jgi:hypothetical protein